MLLLEPSVGAPPVCGRLFGVGVAVAAAVADGAVVGDGDGVGVGAATVIVPLVTVHPEISPPSMLAQVVRVSVRAEEPAALVPKVTSARAPVRASVAAIVYRILPSANAVLQTAEPMALFWHVLAVRTAVSYAISTVSAPTDSPLAGVTLNDTVASSPGATVAEPMATVAGDARAPVMTAIPATRATSAPTTLNGSQRVAVLIIVFLPPSNT
jgi:hypothetical protein